MKLEENDIIHIEKFDIILNTLKTIELKIDNIEKNIQTLIRWHS